MISAGKNITSVTDLLQRMSVKHLYDSLVSPKADVESKIRLLRSVREIDSKRYALLKRQLPYIVCGLFNPPYRRLENFAYTNYFIIDLDHLTDKGIAATELKKHLAADPQVLLCFLSPSGDGLKVMFKLSEPCYDKGLYSVFYKIFAVRFANEHNVEQVLDSSTSDATRACFISTDTEAYYNPDAEPVILSDYANENDSLTIKDALFEVKKVIVKTVEESKNNQYGKKQPTEPDDEVMSRIRQLINPRLEQQKTERQVFVPEELNQMICRLTEYIQSNGIEVKEIINIQYGKKLRMQLNLRQAEINIFYGKRGFSVVQSPRSGTSPELNQLTADLIQCFINENF